MDTLLRTLEQAVYRDPGDVDAEASLRAALRRVADLGDRRRWSAADAASQDLVAATIARLLGPAFRWVGARSYEAGGVTCRVASLRHVASGIELQVIPGGSFLMGSGEGQGGLAHERPQHEVALAPFLLGRYPVRQEEWDQVGGEDRRHWSRQDLPIESVSWVATNDWLARAGDGLRLPSESEWEYACRAGTRTAFFWGEEPSATYCWSDGTPASWESFPPVRHHDASNAFGLVDVSGNVAEWCADHYRPNYRGAPCDGSPRLEDKGARVIRGGDSCNPATHCRSAARNLASEAARGAGIGFRVARDVPW